MDAVGALKLVVQAAAALYVAVQTAKANQKQCELLRSRVSAILQPLEGSSSLRLQQVKSALSSLHMCIDGCCDFAREMSSANLLQQLLRGNNYQQRFAELNERLNTLVADLNVGLNVKQLFDADQDRQAAIADAAYLKDNQGKILEQLRDMDERHMKQEGHMKNLVDRQRIMDQRFASMNAALRRALDLVQQQARQGSAPPQTPSGRFRAIPFYDLALDEKIGSGGFGDVYCGTWLSTDTRVAIKMLHCNELSEEAKQEFIQEVQLMHEIRGYEHVVTLLGACVEDTHRCLVMEYVQLGSLFHLLRRGVKWDWNQRCEIAYQLVKSINYLHTLHPPVLHRDIKSMNFLVSGSIEKPVIKVADFGLSRIRHESTIQQYSNAGISGTIAWSAPEQFSIGKRKPKYSEKCDVYSLGMVLWELATGELPYEGETSESIRAAVKSGDREEIPDQVPAFFRDWITLCWDQNPQNRPSCQWLLSDIKVHLGPSATFPYGSRADSSIATTVRAPTSSTHTNSDFPVLADSFLKLVTQTSPPIPPRPTATLRVEHLSHADWRRQMNDIVAEDPSKLSKSALMYKCTQLAALTQRWVYLTEFLMSHREPRLVSLLKQVWKMHSTPEDLVAVSGCLMDFSAANGWSRSDPEVLLRDVSAKCASSVGSNPCITLLQWTLPAHGLPIDALSTVSGLTILSLQGMKLGDAGCLALSEQLRHVPQLSSLDLDGNSIGDAGCRALSEQLRHVPQLSILHLSNNSIGDAGCLALSEQLRHVPQLSILHLSYNSIGEAGCRALSEQLRHVPQLSSLHLRSNSIGEAGCRALSEQLHHVPQLSSLDLAGNKIGDAGCRALSEQLRHVPQLSILHLSYNSIGEAGCLALSEQLRHVPQLSSLDLRSNSIGEAGCRALSEQLHHVPQLSSLDLDGNSIGEAGCRALSEQLRHVPQLSILHLSYNSIGEAGCRALSEQLRHVPQLSSLHLRSNSIGEAGCRALSEQLHHVPQLSSLDLAGNKIGDAGCLALSEQLRHVPQLSSLHLRSNSIGEAGCRALSEQLHHVPQLSILHLSNNSIGDAGCLALSEQLRHVPQLSSLSLSNNKIGDAGCLALSEQLRHVPQLSRLVLIFNSIGAAVEKAITTAFPQISISPRLR